MADTDIQLSVGLDSKNIKSRAKNLQKEIQNTFNKIDTSKIDNKTKSTLSQLSKLSAKSEEVQHKMAAMEEAFPQQMAEGFEIAAQEVEKYSQSLARATTEADKLYYESKKDEWQEVADHYSQYLQLLESHTAGDILHATNEEYNKLETTLNDIGNSMAVALSKINIGANGIISSIKDVISQTNLLKIVGNVFTELGAGIQKVARKMLSLGTDLLKMPTVFSKVAGGITVVMSGIVGLFGRVVKTVGQVTHAVGVLAKKIGSVLVPIAQRAVSILISGFKSVLNTFTRMIGTVGRKGVGVFKSFGASIKNSIGSGVKSTNKLTMGAKQLFGTLLGFASLRAVFSKLRNAIKEGMNNLAQWNGGANRVNESLSMLKSSLTQMKNAWATAFAPILTYIAPVLNTLINLCTRAANAVAQLFSALGGSKTFIKAKKVQQNYASSLDSTAASADKAADKVAAFDDLNILGEDNSGGGSGGGGSAGLDPSAMFEEVDIDDKFSDWADKLKEMWANADFTELGQIIGEKLRDALNLASDWLVNTAQPIAKKLGKSLATLLIGFFETEGLGDAIGRFFGEVLNTWIYFQQAFLDELEPHARNLGRFLGDIMMTALETIDFATMGHNLAQKINIFFDVLQGIADEWDPAIVAKAITDYINTAIADIHWADNGKALSDLAIDLLQSLRLSLEGVHWTELGTDIADFLNNIDWVTIGSELAGCANGLIGGLLDTIIAVVEETDWESVGEGVATFLAEIDWESLFDKVFEAMGAALGGLASFLWGLIKDEWGKVVEWWKEVAYEDGEFTIAGLLEGIWNKIKDIGNWLWEHVCEPIINGFKKAFGIASPSKVMEEIGGYIIQGLFNGISSLVNKIIEIWNNIKEKTIEVWNTIKEKVSEIWNKLKEKISTTITNIKNKISEVWTTIKQTTYTIWTNIKDKVTELVTALKTKITTIWNNIKTSLTTIMTTIKTTLINIWNSIKSSITNVVTNLKTGITTAFTNIKTSVVNTVTNLKTSVLSIFNGLKDGLRSVINSILGFVEMLANGVVNGINTVIGALNNLHIDAPDWVTSMFGISSFGFNIPRLSNVSLPRLAEGAVIPPNKQFLAMLGDQRNGTNIEAPLETIKEALRDVMANMEVHNTGYSEMKVDGQTFARLMTPYVVSELRREGYNVSILEG